MNCVRRRHRHSVAQWWICLLRAFPAFLTFLNPKSHLTLTNNKSFVEPAEKTALSFILMVAAFPLLEKKLLPNQRHPFWHPLKELFFLLLLEIAPPRGVCPGTVPRNVVWWLWPSWNGCSFSFFLLFWTGPRRQSAVQNNKIGWFPV